MFGNEGILVVLLYHITHVNNLRSILQNDGLLAQVIVQKNQQSYKDVANAEIPSRRSHTRIPIGPCGSLHDYVPFYFASRSPMLYSVCNQGGIPQDEMIYFMTDTDTIQRLALPFVFTDAHAIMRFTNFYDDLANLDKVDWEVMNAFVWRDDNDHPNRKSKRQAEFLIHEKVPIAACIGLAVKNERVKVQVQEILKDVNIRLPIGIRGNFYF